MAELVVADLDVCTFCTFVCSAPIKINYNASLASVIGYIMRNQELMMTKTSELSKISQFLLSSSID